MHIHEYQAKMLLRQYGIAVSDFAVISNVAEVNEAIAELGLSSAVVKAQVHAGGRGKAGGVKIAQSPQEIRDYTKQLLGMRLTNQQTGEEGIRVNQVLISPLINIKHEYYVGAIIDRQRAQGVLITSPEGGVEIEEIAAKTPERILVTPIGPNGQLRHYQLIQIAKFMKWEGRVAEEGKRTILLLAKAFVETDAVLLEINPLVQTEEGEILALDAKLTVDENALYRQPQLFSYFDPTQLPSNEARAHEHDLAYVALKGDIGCMVNGAGLAMATMDIIHYYGGRPANFLDVGGGASKEKVGEGFKIILSDPQVKAVLVNIFGGIMNCVTLAAGIISAAAELGIRVPLVVRMEGTNVDNGRKILQDAGLNILIADSLAEAAEKVVNAAKGK
ncbi:MAG: ADP-forming succinate--CoA ligase subunit beta [Parachlamydiaceae bacterium]|nr:ADP-forming succinate--CoA ligase subunit beta [Parachlamydiaceae bacterium]